MNTPPQLSPIELNALILLYKTGRYTELENRSQQLVQQYPDAGMLYKLLGASLSMQGKDALPTLLKTAELLHGDAETRNNIGNILEAREQLDEAVEYYLGALKINPEFVEAHYNLGNALHKLGRLADAITSYRNALKINPSFALVHSNLGSTLLEFGLVNEALASCRRALELEREPNLAVTHSNLLGMLNHTHPNPADYLAEALRFGKSVTSKVTARFNTWQCVPQPLRLRVGIVSADLHNHPVGYFLENFLLHLDRNRIELIAYTNSPIEDDLTLRIKPHFAHWREIYALNDPAAAGLIHSDGVHILIDLSGHTSHNRLPVFAWKPAPVQATWLGYFASTGMEEMDYILGDKWTFPESEAHHFTEKGWRLSGVHSCLTPPAEQVNIETLPALQSHVITFGTLNNIAKMNDRVVACWGRILNSIPNSRLYLNTQSLRAETLKRSIIDRYAVHGIDATRLILEATTGRFAALDSYNRIDIALDPFPYPGGTTSYEALWMGVPIITLRGHNYISHLGESILHNAGLPDWIARDEADYVAKAIRFAGDLPKLSALRNQLREQVRTSPLFDAPRFAKHFEAALWGMWQDKAASRQTATPVPA